MDPAPFTDDFPIRTSSRRGLPGQPRLITRGYIHYYCYFIVIIVVNIIIIIVITTIFIIVIIIISIHNKTPLV